MNNALFPCAGNNVGKVDAGLDTLLEEAMFFSMRLGGVRWYKPLENQHFESENISLEKEKHLQTTNFGVPAVS